MARCLRCPNDTTAVHGLCDDCLTAAAHQSAEAQGLPAVIPADDPVWAELGAVLAPVHGPAASRSDAA